MIRIGVYGTLRRGFGNHLFYGLGKLPMKGSGFIRGLLMYLSAYQGYPSLTIGTPKSKAYFELYDVPETTFAQINRLEREFGYTAVKIKLKDFGDTIVFAKAQNHPDQLRSQVIESYEPDHLLAPKINNQELVWLREEDKDDQKH